jgi:hypothetical protein
MKVKSQQVILFLLIASIICNVVMITTMIDLPEKIKDSINSSQVDLMQLQKPVVKDSIKIVTANLPSKGDLVFFEGKIISKGEKLRDTYEWVADDPIPEEIWDGYIHLAKSKTGGKYYIWADWKMPKNNVTIKGWFTTITPMKFGIGKLIDGKNEDHINIIIPVVQKKELKDGI